jgi:hypothetical protein
MASARTRGFIIAATFLGGMLAGPGLDRLVVQMPSWRHLGITSWAAYSREAETGRGLIWYPVQGISALLASVAAALAFRLDRTAPRAGALPTYAAALMAVAALVVTIQGVAPATLSLRRGTDDPLLLQATFDQIQRWWPMKASLHILTFAANLWSLVVVTAGPGAKPS